MRRLRPAKGLARPARVVPARASTQAASVRAEHRQATMRSRTTAAPPPLDENCATSAGGCVQPIEGRREVGFVLVWPTSWSAPFLQSTSVVYATCHSMTLHACCRQEEAHGSYGDSRRSGGSPCSQTQPAPKPATAQGGSFQKGSPVDRQPKGRRQKRQKVKQLADIYTAAAAPSDEVAVNQRADDEPACGAAVLTSCQLEADVPPGRAALPSVRVE